MIPLGVVAVASLLAAAPGQAAARPSLPTPVCTITGATYVPAASRLIGKGSCPYRVRQPNGAVRKVVPSLPRWTYAKLATFDRSGSVCALAHTAGTGNSVLVQPKGAYKLVVTYRLWLPANRYHRAGKVVNKTVGLVLGGRSAVCAPLAVVAPEGAGSPTGSGNGGNAQYGFACGWNGQLTVNQSGIHIPKLIDCSGNGSCAWIPQGSLRAYGLLFDRGSVRCSNGMQAIPNFVLTLSYEDGTSCKIGMDSIQTFPASASYFTGVMSGTLTLQSFGSDGGKWPDSPGSTYQIGPIHGTGTTQLCQGH